VQKLSDQQIDINIKHLKGWELVVDAIQKKWEFENFIQAMKFINRVAELAELSNHHPEILNVYNKVTLRLTTHDVNGLSERDFKLAAEIDKISL